MTQAMLNSLERRAALTDRLVASLDHLNRDVAIAGEKVMFAILKDKFGFPAALFEIDRETPMRYYGRIHDPLDKWFYLRGLTRCSPIKLDHVIKEIVLVVVHSDNAWFAMKDELLQVKKAFCAKRAELEEERNEFNHVSHDKERAARDEALKKIKLLIGDKYI